MSNNHYQFSDKLKETRKNMGLSQAELAEGIGVSQRTIASWELNERYPTLDKLYDIAKFLKTSVRSLI